MQTMDQFNFTSKIPEKLMEIITRADNIMKAGYTPLFHFNNLVLSPDATLELDKELAKRLKIDYYEDYPFVNIQVLNVPVVKIAEIQDVPVWLLKVLYLDLNNYVTKDFHNALCDLLSISKRDLFNLFKSGYQLSIEEGSDKALIDWLSGLAYLPDFNEYCLDYFYIMSKLTIDEFKEQCEVLLTRHEDCLSGQQVIEF